MLGATGCLSASAARGRASSLQPRVRVPLAACQPVLPPASAPELYQNCAPKALARPSGLGYVKVCLFSVPAPPRYASVTAGFFVARLWKPDASARLRCGRSPDARCGRSPDPRCGRSPDRAAPRPQVSVDQYGPRRRRVCCVHLHVTFTRRPWTLTWHSCKPQLFSQKHWLDSTASDTLRDGTKWGAPPGSRARSDSLFIQTTLWARGV
jgi:hypothetical protein